MKHLLVVCTAVASLLAVAAAAQGVGFQAGAAFDPKQIYVGSHIEFPPVEQGVPRGRQEAPRRRYEP